MSRSGPGVRLGGESVEVCEGVGVIDGVTEGWGVAVGWAVWEAVGCGVSVLTVDVCETKDAFESVSSESF